MIRCAKQKVPYNIWCNKIYETDEHQQFLYIQT